MCCYVMFEQVAWAARCDMQQLICCCCFDVLKQGQYLPERNTQVRCGSVLLLGSCQIYYSTDAILLFVLEHFLKFLIIIIIALLSLGHYQIKGR